MEQATVDEGGDQGEQQPQDDPLDIAKVEVQCEEKEEEEYEDDEEE